MKIQNALVSNIRQRSQRYFAHVTTVTLSWRVQNIVVIGRDVVLIYSQLCSTPLYIGWWYCLGWLFMLWSFSGSVLYIRTYSKIYDDVIKWKHFPRNWPFVREIHRSPVNFPHKGQWRGALMFSLIYAWINDWVNNREAGDLRRQHGHYDVIVMY